MKLLRELSSTVLIVGVEWSQEMQDEKAKQDQLEHFPIAMHSQLGILADSPSIEIANLGRYTI